MNKPSEAIRYFEELMRSPRSSNDTYGLGHPKHHSLTEEGESSKSGELRNTNLKVKHTCYHCGKLGHTTNICGSKTVMQNPNPNFSSYCFSYKKQGHQTHECRSKVNNTPTAPRFEGYCYNFQKCGHRAHECISQEKSNWTTKNQDNAPNKGNPYNWDYNTWYFKGKHKKWLNGHKKKFSCHKVGHVRKTIGTEH